MRGEVSGHIDVCDGAEFFWLLFRHAALLAAAARRERFQYPGCAALSRCHAIASGDTAHFCGVMPR
jgi:hypothetical protein